MSFGEWSGRADLNGRPLAPQASALTRLRYAPMTTAKEQSGDLPFANIHKTPCPEEKSREKRN